MLRMKGLIVLMAVVSILVFLADSAMARKDLMRFGTNNWAENVAVSNMWKILLEERGYEVELIDVGKAVMYNGVASGDLEIGMEVWLPATDKPFVDQFADDIVIQEPWYKGTGLGLAVPIYVDIDSMEELKGQEELFNGEIIGIDSGSSLNALTRDAVDEYGLDYDFIESSEPAMLASLKTAYSKNEPVVVTLWNPHWVFSEYELKYLGDPRNIYGDGDDIFFITRKGFDKDFPEVLDWMNKWFMTDDTLGELMALIEELNDPVQGASIWIEKNQDLVDSWFE